MREFLDELKTSDPGDFAAVLAGLAKLQNRQYHREPLSKAVGEALFELRHVGKLNTRVFVVLREGSPNRRGACGSKQRPETLGSRHSNRARSNARLAEKKLEMKKTNFDRYLEGQLQDPAFAARFERAGEAWDVALQIAALRQQAGLSQKDLAKLLKTSQQQISRLESPGYEGHSLSMLRRVAAALHAHVRIVFEPTTTRNGKQIAESRAPYGAKRLTTKRK